MANFTAADVKKLREVTGAGMSDCKKALVETDGDFDKAVEILRIKGAKDVGKRAERNALRHTDVGRSPLTVTGRRRSLAVPQPPWSGAGSRSQFGSYGLDGDETLRCEPRNTA